MVNNIFILMQVVILAGGVGTRISEETLDKPKPMVEIGGIPILCHIMSIYSYYGYNDFIIALGYRGDLIKKYFLDYYNISSDFSIRLDSGEINLFKKKEKNWKVTLVDTGKNSQTGFRLFQLREHLNNERFMLTYGDGLANIDLRNLLDFHVTHGKVGSITCVRPPARFGALKMANEQVTSFIEKPQTDDGWINGGFFVFEPSFFDYLDDDEQCTLERSPLEDLAKANNLMGYKHYGFWKPMDTLREKISLEKLWSGGEAPWNISNE
jgi:glucose-1-phosphate cytidylyltransferase